MYSLFRKTNATPMLGSILRTQSGTLRCLHRVLVEGSGAEQSVGPAPMPPWTRPAQSAGNAYRMRVPKPTIWGLVPR